VPPSWGPGSRPPTSPTAAALPLCSAASSLPHVHKCN
jgi:hypothetical protein